MADYTQITAFTPKDSLASGNPAKVIRGSEFDAEFEAVATSIQTKADKTGAAFTGNISTTGNLAVDGEIVTTNAFIGGTLTCQTLQVNETVIGIQKEDVGLGNVDNTSDANKPISLAVGAELVQKAPLNHGHIIPEITGLEDQLNAKLNAANPSYTGTLTGGTGVVNLGSGQFYKDAAGNVGIGKPEGLTHKLTIVGNAAQEIYNITQTAVSSQGYRSGTGVYTLGNYYGTGSSWIWRTNPNGGGEVDRMTLDASGNLGLGVTPSAWNGDFKVMQFGLMGNVYGRVSPSAVMGLSVNAYRAASGDWVYKESGAAVSRFELDTGIFYWYTAPAGTAGNPISFTQAMTLDASAKLSIQTADVAIAISANSASGKVRVRPYVDATIGAIIDSSNAGETGYQPLTLVGSTVRFSSGFGALAGQFDSSGNLLVGTTVSPTAGQGGTSIGTENSHGKIRISAASTTLIGLVNFNNANGTVGYIATEGSTTTYATSSDARLKENISDANNGSALIDQLQVRQFDWKADGSHQRYGFIAQELDAVYPEAVSKPADPDEMMGVDYSKLVPLLVQEIQALRARVAALEAV